MLALKSFIEIRLVPWILIALSHLPLMKHYLPFSLLVWPYRTAKRPPAAVFVNDVP
jgi:hypothetical protein